MRRAIMFLLVVTACTQEPVVPVSDAFIVGTTETVASLDPALCYDGFCAYAVLPNTHVGLTSISADLTPEPALGGRWTVSADGRTQTFPIEGQHRLHDGTIVDADVMRTSIERAGRLAPQGSAASLFAGDVTVTAAGNAVEITTPSPDTTVAARLAYVATAAVSPSLYPASAAVESGQMAGGGPYTIDGAPAEGSFDLVRVEGAGPRRVRVVSFTSGTSLLSALDRGQVHLALSPWSPAALDRLASSARVTTRSAPGPGTRFLGFDVTEPPFDDVLVRRAVAASIDRQRLVDVHAGAADPLRSLLPAGLPGAVAAFDEHDAALVDELLADAGFGSDETVPVDLWYSPAHYGEAEADAASAIAASMEATRRFDVTLRAAEWSDFQGALTRSRLGMFLLGWFPDFLDADAYLRPFLHSTTTATIGSNYADDEMDELLDAQRAAMDITERTELLASIQHMVAEDVPYVPLWRPHVVVAHHRSVTDPPEAPSPYLRLTGVSR